MSAGEEHHPQELGKSSGYKGEVATPSLFLCLYRKSLKGMYLFARCIRERKVLKHSLRHGFSDSFSSFHNYMCVQHVHVCVCLGTCALTYRCLRLASGLIHYPSCTLFIELGSPSQMQSSLNHSVLLANLLWGSPNCLHFWARKAGTLSYLAHIHVGSGDLDSSLLRVW